MFGSKILEVALGVIFALLLVSIICTAIRELIEGWLKTRAAFLENGIRELLHDKSAVGIARSFYTHPLIYGLYAGEYTPGDATGRPSGVSRGGALPTYIPSRSFALALLDLAARGPENALHASSGSAAVLSLANVRANVINIENGAVQRVVLTAVDSAQGDLDKAIANVAAWYDSAMDRVSGGYKRATQKLLFIIGLAVAVGLNVNTITIAEYLYRNDAARAAVVARAEAVARDTGFLRRDDTRQYAASRAALDSLQLPIGWDNVRFAMPGGGAEEWNDFFSPLLGWLLTAFAATLGAPFWFDLLNKVMVIRSTVKPHEKSPEEASEDRQTAASKEKIASGDVGAAGSGSGAAGTMSLRAPAAASPEATPAPPEADLDLDGCGVAGESHTPDEELPRATGGVEEHG